MFESLFGAGWPLPVQFLVAFVIVLVLIGATFWLIRRFGNTTLGATATRGRQPRLAVIDAAAVDARRRLVLIRRDNVEHLVMIGGPSDVVIEQNIVRAVPVAPQREVPGRAPGDAMPRSIAPVEDYEPAPREVARADMAPRPEPVARAEMAPRSQPEFSPRLQPEPAPRPDFTPRPLPEATRAEARQPEVARPEPPPRATRPELPVRPPRTSEPVQRESIVPRAPEPPRPEPALTRAPEPLVPRALAEPRVPVPPEAPVARPLTETVAAPPPIVPAAEPAPDVDANLANMAQRLEAALRRPFVPAPAEPSEPRFAAPEPRGPLRLEPVDDEPEMPEPVSAEPPRAEAPRAETPRAETPRPEAARAEPRPEPRPGRTDPARQRSVLDSLEEEMASLLGRPPGKE